MCLGCAIGKKFEKNCHGSCPGLEVRNTLENT